MELTETEGSGKQPADGAPTRRKLNPYALGRGMACAPCRKRKSKCDAARPICVSQGKHPRDMNCVYGSPRGGDELSPQQEEPRQQRLDPDESIRMLELRLDSARRKMDNLQELLNALSPGTQSTGIETPPQPQCQDFASGQQTSFSSELSAIMMVPSSSWDSPSVSGDPAPTPSNTSLEDILRNYAVTLGVGELEEEENREHERPSR
ncbi:hypothetical protein BT69DRAFT_1319642 [Atractiella rhizophila]|nr:hypothetical protein BT69DRAFT_1319642 [Atractiella rhizophila]